MQEDKILQKLIDHDQRFDEIDMRFEDVYTRFDEHDQRFDKHDKKFDQVIAKLIEHDERLDQMVTKTAFNSFRNEMLTGQDKIITILKRLDEERFSIIDWLKRHDLEINKIKGVLKLT